MGKKLIFSKAQPTKPLYKSMKKSNNFFLFAFKFAYLKPFGRFSWIYLGISLTKQKGFLIFEISNFPI